MSPHLIRRSAPLGATLVALLGLTACGDTAAPEATAVAPPSDAPAAAGTPPATPPAANDLGVPKDYDCAGTAIEVIYLEHAAILQLDGETVRLGPVAAASGARYQGYRADGVVIDFWEKSGTAMLSVAGNEYPECSLVEAPAEDDGVAAAATVVPDAPATLPALDATRVYVARGNEPFWLARVDAAEVLWSTPDSATPQAFAVQSRAARADGFDLSATREGSALTLAATATVCRDSMTGMPYPHTVAVTLGDRDLRGCGGEPIDLLAANEWTVASIGGTAMSGRAPTLQFTAEGRAAGFAGCNRWTANTTLTGEGLSLGMAAATRMACLDETASKQETDFLAALGRITSHDFDQTGNLLLKAGDETVIVAVRQSGTEPSNPM